MDFVWSSYIHRGCPAQPYRTEYITDDQVGCELPGGIPDLDNQETKKKQEQSDSHHKSCPPSVQRTLFPNNESSETTPNPNMMDDPDPMQVTYKSMCGMMTNVLFDVLPKVLPQAAVKDVLPNEVTEKNTAEVITNVLYDVLPKLLPQALNDVLPKVLPEAFNEILPKVMPGYLEKAMHENLINKHRTAFDSANKKDKTEEVNNKDSEPAKPVKVNESEENLYNVHGTFSNPADKKDKPEEVDNKDCEAPKPDEHGPKVDEFEVAVEGRTGSPINCKSTIDLETYSSPVPNLMVPTTDRSIILLETRPDNCPKRDVESARKRNRAKFLNRLWIDPEIRKKRKRVTRLQLRDISDDDDLLDPKYDAFLKSTGNDISLYVGQHQRFTRENFLEMKNPSVLFSNLHVDSFMDVLWRRRCSKEAEYAQDITMAECSFYRMLATKWEPMKKTLKRVRKSNRKNVDPRIDFPNIDVTSFVHDDNCLDVVRGGGSIQLRLEWWNMKSVLIPCNVGHHWVLCHLFPEDGAFTLYDSLRGRSSSTVRVTEMDCISYLMPSLLHQSGYYEHKGI